MYLDRSEKESLSQMHRYVSNGAVHIIQKGGGGDARVVHTAVIRMTPDVHSVYSIHFTCCGNLHLAKCEPIERAKRTSSATLTASKMRDIVTPGAYPLAERVNATVNIEPLSI